MHRVRSVSCTRADFCGPGSGRSTASHGVVKNTLYGHAAREIVEDAKAHDVGAIIMGSRGRSDLAGLVLGSTAHKVIHLTDRPVLVVR
jgi:nucleotide-binding universal stress UspA family protein